MSSTKNRQRPEIADRLFRDHFGFRHDSCYAEG